MIRIHRGDEPPELTLARSKHLPQLHAIVAGGQTLTAEHFTGYGPKAVRDALREAQHGKCCYCEKELDAYDDIEHHRPKTSASRGPGSALEHGYWWLAHVWNNLFYSCRACNGYKRTQFPLGEGSIPLGAGEAPPGGELPLLIDPAATSGILHIQFKPVRVNGREKWIPRPRNMSPLGEWTIKVCKLDRGPLLDSYTRHVTFCVMQFVHKVKEALREPGNARGVRDAVDTASRALLRSSQLFVGLSYDALQHFITNEDLAPLGLAWQMPP